MRKIVSSQRDGEAERGAKKGVETMRGKERVREHERESDGNSIRH